MKNDQYYYRLAWAWVLGWTVLRLVWSNLFLLTPDETNYWQWGRHLAWGYHDQAPLIGWAIRLSTEIFGNNSFGVRLPTVLAMGGACAYLVALSGRWFGASTAWAVALLTQGVLEFNAGGLLATADGVQALGWSGAAYHTARAYEDDAWGQWLLAGFWFGFGLLSKFTMVIFAPGAYVFGLLSPRYRPRLARLKPYIGLGLGLVLFAPVLWWNAAHGWNSARHVAHIGGADGGFSLQFKYFGDFLGSQAALLTPLVLVLIIWAWVWAVKNRKKAPWIVSYCFWTSLPLVALFLVMSFKTRIYGNWPGAGYLTASVLAAAFFAPRNQAAPGLPRPRPRLWKATIGFAYAVSLVALLQVGLGFFPLPASWDRTATELAGWDKLGREAARIQDTMPDPANTFLFGMRYQEASELAFYAPGQPDTVSINRWNRPNVYDYWVTDQDVRGMDAVGVTRWPEHDKTRLNQVFERVEPAITFDVYARRLFGPPVFVRTLYIYKCYNFRGGLRWVPKKAKDVRAG